MTFARFALRDDKAILFAVIVAALLGVRAYFITPQSIFPTMSFSRIDVVATVGDLPPDQVRVAVTRPLEQALQTLPSVTNVFATSSQGSAELVVSFSSSTDPRADLQLVDQAIAQVRAGIPAADAIVAAAIDPNREPVLSYALTSADLSQAVLRQIATTQIVPKLFGTPGLARVLVTGGPATEYHVDLDPAQLAAHGIGAPDVSRALADANTVQTVGAFDHAYQRYAVLIDTSLTGAASLGRVQIPTKRGASVPLASMGTIALGVSPVTDQTSIDGTHAVILNAFGLPGADTVAMARAFRARVADIVPALPRDITVKLFWDQTSLIVASQTALRDAILAGALLAVVVIFLFLRSVRLTLVATAVIPLAIAIAIFALQLAGQTLNVMSVGGLAVAVGLIIDDAIVVIENIARNRREHPNVEPDAAIERSMGQLTAPMIASTTATVVVFLPLALLTGVTGFFVRALAFTLSASLIVSLFLALFIAPVFARALLRGEHVEEPERDATGGVLDRYEPALRWALNHRLAVGVGSLAVFAATALLLLHLPSDFLPKMDEGQFEIAYALPPGASLLASDAAATTMERVVAADPAVADVGRFTGIDSNGVSPTQPNQGLLRVRLREPGRRASYDAVSARLRDRLAAAVPAARFDYHQILEDAINDLSGTPAPIDITLQGNDQQTLIALAGHVSGAIATIPGVVDASPGVTYDAPSLRIAPRGSALAALGLTAGDVGDAVSGLGLGTIATRLPAAQALVPVRVLVGTRDASSLLDPATSLFADGLPTSIGDVATLTQQRLASDITTQNGQMQMHVTANFQGVSLSRIVAGIRTKLAAMTIPPGYSATIGGQAQSQSQSFGEFVNVIGLAVALVFAVMLATFRSYRLPLVILIAIPLALVGVALGLFLTGTAVNVSSFMGLLLLVGIVVKNGILLIDVANRRRADGADVTDALIVAGRTRLRPIVMTTLAAIGGLLPLAIGIGQGAEMEKPLAIAVIGGLSTATIFTLIVIPVLYAAFSGEARPRARRATFAVPAAFALALVAGFTLAPRDASAQGLGPAPIAVFAGLSADDAQRAALIVSPDIAAAQARLDEGRYAYMAARGSAAPALVATYVQVPQGNPPGANVTSRIAGAQLQWTLGDFLAFGSATRAAALDLSSFEADFGAAQTAERVKTIGLYYDALKARAVAGARRDALALAMAQRDVARARTNAGDAPRLDIVRSDVAVARAEADVESSSAADQNAGEALRAETGVGESVLASTVSVTAPPIDPTLTDPSVATDLARRRRREIASARLAARAADLAVRGARLAGFPALTVGLGYEIGSDSGVPVDAPTIGANLAIPLSGVAHDRVAIAVAKAAEANAKAISVERTIVLDAAAAARSLGAAQRAETATTRARSSAEAELRATELGYRNGASSSFEVTSARSTYVQATVDELSAVYDVEKARASLAVELGLV